MTIPSNIDESKAVATPPKHVEDLAPALSYDDLFRRTVDGEDENSDGVDTSWLDHYFEEQGRKTADQTAMGIQSKNDSPLILNGERVLTRILEYVIVGDAIAVRPEDLKDVKLAFFELEAAGEGPQLADMLRSLAKELEVLLAERERTLKAVSQEQLANEFKHIKNEREKSQSSEKL